MFEFIFQGSFGQFSFFAMIVDSKVPTANLTLDHIESDEIHCCMIDDPRACFEVGMILAACYSKFEHLKNTDFEAKKTETNG